VNQGAVHPKGVANSPAYVGGREHRFTGISGEDVLHGQSKSHRVAAGITLDSLWFGGRTRGV
jgi:hypothetical protein